MLLKWNQTKEKKSAIVELKIFRSGFCLGMRKVKIVVKISSGRTGWERSESGTLFICAHVTWVLWIWLFCFFNSSEVISLSRQDPEKPLSLDFRWVEQILNVDKQAITNLAFHLMTFHPSLLMMFNSYLVNLIWASSPTRPQRKFIFHKA